MIECNCWGDRCEKHGIYQFDKLEKERDSYREAFEKLKVACEFYGDKGEWGDIWMNFGQDENGDDIEGDVFCCMNTEDVDLDENDCLTYAGKTARLALKQVEEIMEKLNER